MAKRKTRSGKKPSKQRSAASTKANRGRYEFGTFKKLKVSTISVYASLSDLFMKKDLVPIQGALAKLLQLNGYYYSWKNQDADSRRQAGLIAQDVEKVFPEAVSWTRDSRAAVGETMDTLGVDYPKVIALLVEALKEQQSQIEELRRQAAHPPLQ